MDAIRRPYSDRMLELFQSPAQGGRNSNSRPSRHSFDLSHQWEDHGGSDPGSVISVSNTSSNDVFHRLCKQFGISHPARFPEALAEFFIKAGTKEGDVVLDPFGGSGTTSIVAHRLGRDSIYIDINPDYVQMAQGWFHVEFSTEELYSKNIALFCTEILPKCKWHALPFDFLFDLYKAWLAREGLFEKPQTKKEFSDRIAEYLEGNSGWTVSNRFINVKACDLAVSEPLIVEYHLNRWMKKENEVDSQETVCTPQFTKCRGICRDGQFTIVTE